MIKHSKFKNTFFTLWLSIIFISGCTNNASHVIDDGMNIKAYTYDLHSKELNQMTDLPFQLPIKASSELFLDKEGNGFYFLGEKGTAIQSAAFIITI